MSADGGGGASVVSSALGHATEKEMLLFLGEWSRLKAERDRSRISRYRNGL